MYAPITGVGDGSAPVVNLTFDYLDQAYVKAAVDGAEVPFTWTGVSQITFDDAVAVDANWMVYRDTSITLPLVDFMDSSVLTEDDLDTAHNQLRHHQEEIDARYGTLADADVSASAAASSAAASASSAAAAASSATAADSSADSAAAAAALAASAVNIPNASANASSRAALALLSSSVPAILAEAGREGVFVFDSSDLSAEVAADTEGGLYVAPATDPTGASGAWVRKFSGPVNVKWFGATGDGATDDGPAFLAALALLKAIAVNQVGGWYEASPALFIPAGHYFLGTNTLDITHTLVIEGEGSGVSTPSTKLRWASGATGIRVQRYNTSGATDVIAPGFNAGDGTVIRGLELVGGYAGTEGEFHGIHLRAMASIEHVKVSDFEGDGIYSDATAGAGAPDEGAANLARVSHSRFWRNRQGMFVDGADTNVWTVEACDFSGNRTWGVNDSSFLGNTYVACHTAGNGWDGAIASTPTACTYLGNRYAVKDGQAAGASTNAPSGTTEDNTWWLYIAPGGVYNGVVPWVSGTTFREGGAYRTDNANAQNVLVGSYSEGDQNPSQFNGSTMVISGLHGANYRGAAFASAQGGYYRVNNLKVVNAANHGFQLEQPSTATPLGRLDWNLPGDINVGLQGFNSSTSLAWTILNSGASTNWSFELLLDGTANPVGQRKLNFPNGFGLASKKVLSGTAPPGSGAYVVGDLMVNSAPAAGEPAGWVVTVAGSPGTWEPFGIVSEAQAAAQADSVAADVATLVADFNALLAKLRAANLMDT